MKKQTEDWKNTFAMYRINKGFLSKMTKSKYY